VIIADLKPVDAGFQRIDIAVLASKFEATITVLENSDRTK
jgi:hypothetical protein